MMELKTEGDLEVKFTLEEILEIIDYVDFDDLDKKDYSFEEYKDYFTDKGHHGACISLKDIFKRQSIKKKRNR